MERKLDNLGRIVLPKEMRTKYRLKIEEPVEIKEVEEGILITKVGCYICGKQSENYKKLFGKNICTKCIELIKEFC